MANYKRKGSKVNFSKQRNRSKPKGGYSADEKRAYWIGAGICSERYGDGEKFLFCNNDKIRVSAQNGFNAEYDKNLASRLRNKK